MKNRFAIFLIALGFLVFAVPFLSCSETDPETMINHAYSVMTSSAATSEDIIKVLREILDASVLILPKSGDSEEFKSRIDVAKKMMVERGMLNEKARQYLGFAYKLVTGGKAWQMSEELASAYRQKDMMEQGQKIGRKLIESALAERKAGRNQDAVRCLLEFVLMVVTPIEA
jgi:hypothetical protein